MGNCFSVSFSCDQCMNNIINSVNVNEGYIRNLPKNLVSLETTIEELKARRDDLLRRITREENRGLQRLAEIQVWLNRVEDIENRVEDVLSARNAELQSLCVCGFCSTSLIQTYRYGKNVFLILREVEFLKSSGHFDGVAEQTQVPTVEERPLQAMIIGQETAFQNAWNHLMKDEVGIMGLYGMGGVGKTTLLKQLNNKFSDERHGFEFIIWVVVSRELETEKILDEIAQKVRLGGEEWKQKEKNQKADVIYNFLRKRRFVLFLDDLWEKVDLSEIGIPVPTTQNRCKVAFTTRSQEVCARMGVENPMEIKCLKENEAFGFFQKKVGQTTLRSDPEIPELARIVAKKCRGLPLALDVVGETMSCKRTVQEWRHAIDVLTSYATEFSGMEDKILPLLKYSYDNLKGDHVKSCFLYCALFPEDYKMPKVKMIGYWISEGIIDGSKGIERAENKGYEIIGSLVRASLLMEDVDWHGMDIVYMHDVVHEMALWIASFKQKDAFVVHPLIYGMPKVENWNVVRRMSLMGNKAHSFTGSPECRELTTLLLQKGKLAKFSSGFFKSMPKLLVLDLSDNENLSETPEGVSKLGSLKYLNLAYTPIRDLPKDLQEFEKLIYLDISETRQLLSISGISGVHNLKVLNLYRSGFSWDVNTVEELEALKHLEVLTTSISVRPRVEQFLSSHKLTSCTRSLDIWNSKEEGPYDLTLPVTMEKLRVFCIESCTISEIKMGKICIKSKKVSPLHNPATPCFSSLSEVYILDCNCLRELTLLMFAPSLKRLVVRYSNQLEDVINKEKASEGQKAGIVPFPNLNRLVLDSLPKLKNIHSSPLPFPCLKRIDVFRCPSLRKLPLDSRSGMHGENAFILRYTEKEWIDGVEWEDEATKTHFSLSTLQIDYSQKFSLRYLVRS
ncbi:unnamed protein product [Eruca vesicaria subsp. sativa]|uniref:NB-ARC domain-containing protein n=1 Tax=Eruca vesicaria subsp. sativa TaxID=29727 RepID=A0ABC8JCE4_ERUVS|nr:unnamed protein product [Eruca vesicaria subsp. sativa]